MAQILYLQNYLINTKKNMNKTILIFMPSIENGGVEKNLFIISNFIQLHTNNIKLITYNDNIKKKIPNIDLIIPKIKINTNKRKLKYFFCLIELFKILLTKNEILVFAFQANLYCALLCLLFPKVRLITRSNSSPSGWSKNNFKIMVFKILFKRIDKIIVNSQEFKREINKKFNIKSDFIYNPLNKKEIIEKSKIKLNFNFFRTKKIKIINIGRLVDQKDQYTFLKALNILNNKIQFKALIIGSGILEKKLREFIIDNKLEKKIKILSFKKNPYNYLKKSDLLVHTAKYEGLPNILLEAQVLKKYIISTKCPTGPNEILMSGSAGSLVNVGDYKQVANEILNFCKNKNELKKKITKGYLNLERFDSKKNLEKYLKVVNSLMQIK